MNLKNAPIAVFDSGLGGLSVLRALRRCLPHENFIFFGDQKHAPYGEKTPQEVCALCETHAARFFGEGAKALVIACNTATAAAAEQLRLHYPDKIIIGIEPAVKPAVLYKKNSRVLILATPLTIRESKLHRLVETYGREAKLYLLAAPRLVNFVEEGLCEPEALHAYLCELLAPHRLGGPCPVDAVVLGCTHFPFARDAILEALGYAPVLFDGSEGTARETKRRLAAQDLLNEQTAEGRLELFSSAGALAPEALIEKYLSS